MHFIITIFIFLILVLIPFVVFASDTWKSTVKKAEAIISEVDKMGDGINIDYDKKESFALDRKKQNQMEVEGEVVFPHATPLVLGHKAIFKYVSLFVLDKTTQKKKRIKVAVGKYHILGNIALFISGCQTIDTNEKRGVAAFANVWDIGLALAQTDVTSKPTEKNIDKIGTKILSAWIYSHYPSLSYLEHSVYDVRLESCTHGPNS